MKITTPFWYRNINRCCHPFKQYHTMLSVSPPWSAKNCCWSAFSSHNLWAKSDREDAKLIFVQCPITIQVSFSHHSQSIFSAHSLHSQNPEFFCKLDGVINLIVGQPVAGILHIAP
ncbi:hypothetical protein RDI58_002473 [Solanum bulbocastanum]|uniref:Uncharacterized protein n=1 Tax=Solanum bulbocastanum TaxID=147425 RepID=A0AAN8YR59_SOLBU